jgi:hypothetical protein
LSIIVRQKACRTQTDHGELQHYSLIHAFFFVLPLLPSLYSLQLSIDAGSCIKNISLMYINVELSTIWYSPSMCDTVLSNHSHTGQSIESFLRKSFEIDPRRPRPLPRLTIGTTQRLLGHIAPEWVSDKTYQALLDLQEQHEGTSVVERMISPAFRSIEDFVGRAVVAKVALDDKPHGSWEQFDTPLLDQETGDITLVVNDIKFEGFDPRNPMLWPADEYWLMKQTRKVGKGNYDRVADVATAAIRLCGFSDRPRIPQHYITAALRNFSLTGK